MGNLTIERASVAIELLKPRSGFLDYKTSPHYVFALVNTDMKQATIPGTCRGERIAAIYDAVNGTHSYLDIHGEIGFDKLRLLVQRAGLGEQIHIIEDFINQIERAFGLELSVISTLKGSKNPDLFYFEGDAMWLMAPMFSLCCLLIRTIAPYHIANRTYVETLHKVKETGQHFLASTNGWNFFNDLLTYTPKAVFGTDIKSYYPDGVDSSYSRHDFGIDHTANNNRYGDLAYEFGKVVHEVHRRLEKLKNPSPVEKVRSVVRRKRPVAVPA